jgi:choline-sulfatase
MADRPNFLVIMTDEHNPLVSEPYGHTFVRTPHLQRLAERGIVFENAYCNSPLTAPSRASFMTGKLVHRIGVWENRGVLPGSALTWAHRLSQQGYDTAISGKMHFNGKDQHRGFQRRLVGEIGAELSKARPNATKSGGSERDGHQQRLQESGPGDSFHQQYDERVADGAVQYLAEPERRERPWALCVGLITPHFPLIVRQQYWELYFPAHADLPNVPPGHLEQLHPQSRRFRAYFALEGVTEEQTRRGRAAYYGLVNFADHQIGVVLEALERNGLGENTVVVYTSDHGELMGEHGLWWKCSFYEGSSRVPLIISWPGRFTAGRRTAVVSLVDVTRTVLELAGSDVGRADLDGRVLTGLLAGGEPDDEGLAFSEYEAHGTDRPGRMVRRGSLKLNYYHGEPVELFDLAADPGELNDLANDPEQAAIREELTALVLEGWDPVRVQQAVSADRQRRAKSARGPILRRLQTRISGMLRR